MKYNRSAMRVLRHVWLAAFLFLGCERKAEQPLLPPEPEIVPRSGPPQVSQNDPLPKTPRPARTPFHNPDEIPGAPPITKLPAEFARLPEATRLEIRDEWNGLGPTHDVYVQLERRGTRFKFAAKVGSYPGALGELHPDPASPRMKWKTPCACGVDDTCPCEQGSSKREKGSVSAAVVERFLRTIASHALDDKQDWRTGRMWTDDYPKGHVAVWVPDAKEPIHLSYLDQRRHWRVGGAFLAPDPDAPANAEREGKLHAELHGDYMKLLQAIGLDRWRKSGSGRGL